MRDLACLEKVVAVEMTSVESLSEAVWDLLALSAPSSSARELRAKTTRTALVTRAHLNEKVFYESNRLPFRLCKGDKEKRLRDLAAAERPLEPTSQQFLGFASARLSHRAAGGRPGRGGGPQLVILGSRASPRRGCPGHEAPP